MLYKIFFVIEIIAFICFFTFSVIGSIHFFQLNSYKPKTHFLWLKKNKSKYIIPVCAVCALALIMIVSIAPILRAVLLTVLFDVLAVLSFPKKAKKPLVYTARVKRMLVTAGIITVVPLILSFCFGSATGMFIAQGVYTLISPLFIMLANLINRPMEKGINNGYIKEARDILASCPEMEIIGVTGSYGKTSVKYCLSALLRARFNVLMTPESYNTPMGVVKTVRGLLKATDEFFVCEMGARWVGDIKELCDIVHPKHGIITSIGPQHLESFGSLENVKKTKFELAQSLPQDGFLFLNGNDENIRAYPKKRPCIFYTVEGDGDYNACDVSASDRGTSFTVETKRGEKETFSTKLIGRHNVLNITGAIAVANTFGIPLSELKGPVRKLEGAEHRLQLLDKGGVLIIDDAYNSNPAGAKAALDALALFDGFKIAVTPGMVELGGKQFQLNKEFGKQMARVCDFVVLVGERQAPPMLEGLGEAGYPEDKIFVASTIQQAMTFVYTLSSAGAKKIILLENDLPDNY